MGDTAEPHSCLDSARAELLPRDRRANMPRTWSYMLQDLAVALASTGRCCAFCKPDAGRFCATSRSCVRLELWRHCMTLSQGRAGAVTIGSASPCHGEGAGTCCRRHSLIASWLVLWRVLVSLSGHGPAVRLCRSMVLVARRSANPNTSIQEQGLDWHHHWTR